MFTLFKAMNGDWSALEPLFAVMPVSKFIFFVYTLALQKEIDFHNLGSILDRFTSVSRHWASYFNVKSVYFHVICCVFVII